MNQGIEKEIMFEWVKNNQRKKKVQATIKGNFR